MITEDFCKPLYVTFMCENHGKGKWDGAGGYFSRVYTCLLRNLFYTYDKSSRHCTQRTYPRYKTPKYSVLKSSVSRLYDDKGAFLRFKIFKTIQKSSQSSHETRAFEGWSSDRTRQEPRPQLVFLLVLGLQIKCVTNFWNTVLLNGPLDFGKWKIWYIEYLFNVTPGYSTFI